MATKLDLADAQFLGFHHGRREPGIVMLVESMGLTKKEWISWKKKYVTTCLTSSEMEEIDNHFKLSFNERLL